MEPLLAIKQMSVSKKQDQNKIISNVNLNILPGDCIHLKGLNGSGKSTLLRSIVRHLDSSVEIAGEILFESKNLLQLSRKELQVFRSNISYLPQVDDYNGHYNVSVKDIIKESISSFRGQKIQFSKIEEVLKGFRFTTGDNPISILDLSLNPLRLSGGQKRALSITANIVARPNAKIYLIDEPFNNLDEANRDYVTGLLRHYVGEYKESAFIIVSHINEIDFYNKIIDINEIQGRN